MQLVTELLICMTINLVFQYGLGLSMLGRMVRGNQNPFLLGGMVTVFCTYGAVASYLLKPILDSPNSDLIRPLIYILAAALLYVILLLLFALFPEKIRKVLASYLHQTAFSCIVLGCCLLTDQTAGSVQNAFIYGLRCGIGFFLAVSILTLAKSRITSEKMPQATRGWPAVLVYAGIISMALSCMCTN